MAAECILVSEVESRLEKLVRLTGELTEFHAELNCAVLSSGESKVLLVMDKSGFSQLVIGRLYRIIGYVGQIENVPELA